MPPSQDITAASFKFKQPIQSTGKRKGLSSVGQRKRPIRTLSQQQPITPQGNRSFPNALTMDLSSLEDSDHEIISSADRAHVLKGVVMVIDRQLWEAQRLTQIATAMGARTADNMNKRVTHVIHSPVTTATTSKQQATHTRIPKLVTQALAASARVVSPQWVMDCYEQKKRLGESYYPFDTDPSNSAPRLAYQLDEENDDNHAKKNRKNKQLQVDDNLFQVNPSDYDVSSDEEEYVEPVEEPQRQDDEDKQDQRASFEEGYDEEQTVQNGQHPPDSPTQSQLDNVQQQQQQQQQNNDEEDEVLLRRKENRSAAISKILQAVKESKERKQQQRQEQHHFAHQHLESDAPEIASSSLGTDDLQIGYLGTEERMQVWYGEQSFYNHSAVSLSSPPSKENAGPSKRRRVTTPTAPSNNRRASKQKK